MSDTHAAEGGQQSGASGQSQQRAAENPNTKNNSPAYLARQAAAGRAGGQQQDGQQEAGDEDGQQQQDGAVGDDVEVPVGKIKITEKKLAEMMERQGAEDARRLTLPKDPNGYELKTSESFKPPAGVKFEFNKDDAVLAAARKLAHERGMDQQTFSNFLDIYASDRIREMTTINNARNAELAKLGSTATQRIDAIKTWAHGTLGSELGGAIEQMLVTERQVRAFEKVIERAMSQGGTQFDNRGREQQQEQAGKIPGYEKMSFEQKRAAQMNQRFAPGGGNR